MIQINGTIRLNAHADDSTIAALVTMIEASRAEDGCLDYSFARDMCDPNVLVLFERWRDEAALAEHGKSAHMAAFQKVMAANPPASREIRKYRTDDGSPL